jgi:hypothetical protein
MQYQAGSSDFDKGMGTTFSVAFTNTPPAKHQVSDTIHIGANVRHVDILYVDSRKDKEMFGVCCLCVPTIIFFTKRRITWIFITK